MVKRLEYFDFLRGIAVIGVVAIHTFAATTAMMDGFNITLLLRQIVNCSVPIFLAISGFFLAKKDLSSVEKYLSFERKHIFRVYIPMVVWSLPYFLASLHTMNLWTNISWTLKGAYSVYYFIPLIIQFYLLLPILQRIANFKGVIASLFVTMCAMGVLYYLFNIECLNLQLIDYAAPFPVWIVFFVVGLYFGKKTASDKANTVLYLWLALFFLVVSYLETYYVSGLYGSIRWIGIKASSTLYSLAVIFFLFSISGKYRSCRVTRAFAMLGDLSFGIYLIHIHVLNKLWLVDAFGRLGWPLKIIVTVALSTVICYCVRWLMPRFSRTFLGL